MLFSTRDVNKLRLIPTTYKNQTIVKVNFAYDKELIARVKAQKGVRWSQTMKSWYYLQKDFKLHAFCQAMKSKAFVDYSALKKKHLFLLQKPQRQNPPKIA